ncbi:MAG: hypothetical protein WBN11_00445, partial [Eudoraea sp.]
MIQSLLPFKVTRTLMVITSLGLMASCGSYQQSSYYDNDGIYAEGSEQVYNNPPKKSNQKTVEDNGVYGTYFDQKAEDLDKYMDSEVFTDVDDYYGEDVSKDSLAPVQDENYFDYNNEYLGYAGWGDNPSNVTINNYNGAGWGWGGGWGWGYPGWGWGGGWG